MSQKVKLQITREFSEPSEEDVKELNDLADFLVNWARKTLAEEAKAKT